MNASLTTKSTMFALLTAALLSSGCGPARVDAETSERVGENASALTGSCVIALSDSPAVAGSKLIPFSSAGGDPYVMLYRTDASTTVADVAGDGAQTAIGTFDADWAQIVSFDYQGNPYLLFYRAGNGEAVTYHVSPSGVSDSIVLGNFDANWKQIVSFTYQDSPYLLFYREGTGEIAIYDVDPNGISNGNWGAGYLDPDWQISSFALDGQPKLLLNREGSQETWVYDISPTGISNGCLIVSP